MPFKEVKMSRISPTRANVRDIKVNDELMWGILSFVNDRLCPVTVQEVRDTFDISKERARRRLEALYSMHYLAKKQISFWNGMYYAERHYYW